MRQRPPADLKRPVEELLSEGRSLAHAVHHALVELLEEARHRRHHRGPYLAQVVSHFLKTLRVGDGRSGGKVAVGVCALIDMAEGKHGHDQVSLHVSQPAHAALDVGGQVVMREQHAFRLPGGSRGVDEGCDVVGFRPQSIASEFLHPFV